jgi:DNA-binding NarL/FixJ family response regulator
MNDAKAPTDVITVFLVDDQAMLRAAFRSWLASTPGCAVVGEAGDARSALADIAKLMPDVVLLDITMPGLSGIDALPSIQAASPKSRIVMVTHHEGESFVQQALERGADGYLSKDSDPEELAMAIRSVVRGRPFISPKVAHALVANRPAPRGHTAPVGLQSLTDREREVFLLLAIGKSNKEVASALGISLGTAKKHRENLQRKLQARSAADLARLAIREGLLGT